MKNSIRNTFLLTLAMLMMACLLPCTALADDNSHTHDNSVPGGAKTFETAISKTNINGVFELDSSGIEPLYNFKMRAVIILLMIWNSFILY